MTEKREELGHMITYKVKATTTSWVQVPTRAGKKLSGHRGYIYMKVIQTISSFFSFLQVEVLGLGRVVQVLEEGRVKEGKKGSCVGLMH